jgi:mannose-6-phosphate isomerase
LPVFFFFFFFFCLSVRPFRQVLSVKQALSIQAHPDKVLAEELHRKFPDIYKDPNHKPEMTLALTPFEVLCGFRPPAQVVAHLSSVPELRAVVGEQVANEAEREKNGSAVLRLVFGALMTAADDVVKLQLAKLIARLGALANRSDLEKAILRIHVDYPGDVGVFCPYILNHFVLAPGEAVFLGPNEPHAYLSGDCIECMATSDNVVRAGLTPKLRDCPTLLSMLTYAVREPQALVGESVVPGVVGYYPPVPDFQVEVSLLMVFEVSHSIPIRCAMLLVRCWCLLTSLLVLELLRVVKGRFLG